MVWPSGGQKMVWPGGNGGQHMLWPNGNGGKNIVWPNGPVTTGGTDRYLTGNVQSLSGVAIILAPCKLVAQRC